MGTLDNWTFDLGEPEAWGPLERFAAAVAATPNLPLLLPCDFMFMGAHDEPFGRVFEYKHRMTRRYLQLTEDLKLVDFVPPINEDDYLADDDGFYRLSRSTRRKKLAQLEIEDFGTCGPADEYCDRCQPLIAMADPTRVGHPDKVPAVVPLPVRRARRRAG